MERFFFNSAIKQPEGTQISFKIKLKRKRSGALWKIVSVQGESTADGAGICGSSDATLMTHSFAEVTALCHVGQVQKKYIVCSLILNNLTLILKQTLSFLLSCSEILPCHMLYICFAFLTFVSLLFLLNSMSSPTRPL